MAELVKRNFAADYVDRVSYAYDVAGGCLGSSCQRAFWPAASGASLRWRDLHARDLIERFPPLKLRCFFRPCRRAPPLSYLFFPASACTGRSEAAMRLASIALTALIGAVSLLAGIGGASASAIPLRRRAAIAALTLFGLCPLAVSRACAALVPVISHVCCTLRHALPCRPQSGAIALGGGTWLAQPASQCSGPPRWLAYALYRYGLERRWSRLLTLAFWGLIARCSAVLALLPSARSSLAHLHSAGQLGHGVVHAVLIDALGFFGGETLGVEPGLAGRAGRCCRHRRLLPRSPPAIPASAGPACCCSCWRPRR